MPKESTFDRSCFFAGTHEEVSAWQRKQIAEMNIRERLESAGELTLRVYGFDPKKAAPKVDRTNFSMRQHNNR